MAFVCVPPTRSDRKLAIYCRELLLRRTELGKSQQCPFEGDEGLRLTLVPPFEAAIEDIKCPTF